MNMKQGCGIGCLVLFSAVVVLMGAATWYSREINREYKTVQKTENALVAATRGEPFTPPDSLAVTPARLNAFLAVRDSLHDISQQLTAAADEFAREKDSNRNHGIRGFLNLLNSGSDLAPVYATYWSTRNRALLAHRMSPAEYIWLYSLVYYHWLGKDPGDGRDEHTTTADVHIEFTTEIPSPTADILAPRRPHLEATYTPELNPIELIFTAREAAGS